MIPVLAGIDLGTSSLKVILVEPAGQLLASAAEEYPIYAPRPGWAEQDPLDWYRAASRCMRRALAGADIQPEQVRGIGLTGQMHTLVCLDRSDRLLRPAILWADQRSAPQADRLTRTLGREKLAAWTGNPLAAGFMLASWQWMRENEPAEAARVCRLLLPKDWLRLQLTGQTGSEPSDASSTLLFDPFQRAWSQPLLAALDIDPDLLPPLGESAQVAGLLLPSAAHDLGLPAGIPVVYGSSDQSAQALAQGVTEPGHLSITIGTGGQIFAPLAFPAADPALRLHLFCHALPGRWHLEAATLSAGLALRWLRDNLWPGLSYQQLSDRAAEVSAAQDGLFFQPFLAGERTPHMDPHARASWTGLRLSHTPAHLTRAVLEGVVFSLRQGLELIEQISPPAQNLQVSGGATGHPLWLQLLADILGRPVQVSPLDEAAGRGAAWLAALATGLTGASSPPQPPGRTIHPNPASSQVLQAAYRQYCAIYPALKSIHLNSIEDP